MDTKMKKKNMIDMDAINNERVETTKKRVAHALKILHAVASKLPEEEDGYSKEELEDAVRNVGKAMSLLTVASEEMGFACSHFKWDDMILMDFEGVIAKLGNALADVIYKGCDDAYEGCSFELKSWVEEAHAQLAKVLGTLVNWFNEDVRLEDV